jgi:hypothetical protein
MTLRDVMTKEEHSVTEHGASQGMQAGDLLFGQLASVCPSYSFARKKKPAGRPDRRVRPGLVQKCL